MGTGTELATLGDTQRLVEWEELPESVRDLPAEFNPEGEGVLMQHQKEWGRLLIDDDYLLIGGEKCRRSGITLCTALVLTVKAASRKEAGGTNIFYIGDTKEKGLEYIGYTAKMARVIAQRQKVAYTPIEQFIFSDQAKRGEDSRDIAAFRVRFSSGYRVVALSSRPENIRGLQGWVVIDEAAFHANVSEVIDACVALLIWGAKIIIISTHNGAKNPYAQLLRDVRNGQYGVTACVYTVTFDQCVANGLYERVCWAKNKAPTPEGKQAWYEGIRKSYGPRKAQMREELDCVPREGDGNAIPGLYIERAMKEERPVLRLAFDDGYIKTPLDTMRRDTAALIERQIKPLLDGLDPRLEHYFGMDFARHGHLSVFVPLQKCQNLMRRVPWVLEMHNTPNDVQEQIVWAIIPRLPRFRGGAMDATGPGQSLAEKTWQRWRAVLQVVFSLAWYRDNMGDFADRFGIDGFDLPKDADHASDLRDLQRIDGVIKLPKLATENDEGVKRHGDYAIALALADHVCTHAPAADPEGFIPVPRADTAADRDRDRDGHSSFDRTVY